MPALVRINNDLRHVQDGQAALQDNVKSVASGLGSVLVLVLEALREQGSRVQSIERSSKAAAWGPVAPGPARRSGQTPSLRARFVSGSRASSAAASRWTVF